MSPFPLLSYRPRKGAEEGSPLTYEELDSLSGEVLPDRTMLAAPFPMTDFSTYMSRFSAFTGEPAGATVHFPLTSEDGKATVYYACHFSYSPGAQGLLGELGLGAAPYSSATCVPAAVVVHN